MNSSPYVAGRLLAVLFLALAIGCQQEASSTATPAEAEAATQPQEDGAHADENAEHSHEVKIVAAEQPIQSQTKAVEPEFFAAPLDSEIEAEKAPVLILDERHE